MTASPMTAIPITAIPIAAIPMTASQTTATPIPTVTDAEAGAAMNSSETGASASSVLCLTVRSRLDPR